MDDYDDSEQEGPDSLEMSDEELQSIVGSAIRDAADYIDTDIGPQRAEATRRYLGEPYGNEEQGRSQVVSMDVRDTVAAMLPSILRVFFGGERMVEFMPFGPEDVATAEQATDYVNQVVLQQDNAGFAVLHAAIKDALVRKTGIVKWWWDERVSVSSAQYSGLDEQALIALVDDPDVEIEVLARYADPAATDPIVDMGSGMVTTPMLADVRVTRRTTQGRARIEAVPPEEFLIDRKARSLDDAGLVAHRTMATVSDLVAMGYDREELDDISGTTDDQFDANEEAYARNPQATYLNDDRNDEAMRRILYVEAYVRVDQDGDGVAELRKVCTLGNAYQVVRSEAVDEVPFATFCPDPEPHTFFGLCPADVVQDIARIKTAVLRNMLDSLAQSIHPRTVVVEGQVSMSDVLNNETGAIIRASAPGMVQPLSTPFVGQAAMPVLAYLDEIKESRTGISKASAGLDADALQSTTKAAVAATISAAQAQIETTCRIFAETGMKRLFRGLLKLICMHQDKQRMVRLRNRWTPIDPRCWNGGMDVVVNVALGRGTEEDRVSALGAIAEKQEQLLQTMGFQNPIVGLSQYRATLAKMVELAGFKNPSEFFAEVPPDWQPPQAEPQQTPEMLLAEVQAQQIRADIEKKTAELQLEREKMLRADDRERDRNEADAMLRAAEIQAKYATQVNVAHLHEMWSRDREVPPAAPQMPPQGMPPQ